MKLKKMIAPIVITALLILYLTAFAAVILRFAFPLWGKILGSVIPLVLVGVSVFVLAERIREIKEGENDDLSKY